MKKITYSLIIMVLLFASCTVTFSTSGDSADPYVDRNTKSADWTIMYYVDADNDLEQYLLDDIQELSDGLASTEMINVIALVDRISGYSIDSSTLGSLFTDTRLYRIGAGEVYPLEGEEFFPNIGAGKSTECNMGDAATLESFINYCKTYYPATNYGLFFTNHGGGVRSSAITDVSLLDSISKSLDINVDTVPPKAVCYDETSGNDSLYTAEITDELNSSHSVDLFVIDACLMGMLEVGYQYRPGVSGEFSADYLVASTPTVWGYGYPYDDVFSAVTAGTITAEELGTLFVQKQKADTLLSSSSESLALYDLSEAANVLAALDAVASELSDDAESVLDTIRGECNSYFDESNDGELLSIPHYDLFDFAESTTGSVTVSLRTDLRNAINSMVVASFGNSVYDNFVEGSNGLGFFFPDGNALYSGNPHWNYQWWYTGIDTEAWWPGGHYYGRIKACHADGDGTVEGWFELLQYKYNNPYSTAFHPGGAW